MGKTDNIAGEPPTYEEALLDENQSNETVTRSPQAGNVRPVSTLENEGRGPPSMRKPIAIPATSRALGSPFLRAYPRSVEAFGISQDGFMDFLDTFNRVAVKSPPLQVIGLAGTVLSFVPVHNINLIGMGVDFGSKIVGRVISKGRSELLLRKVNREMFGPRGLKVEIAKLDGLAKIAGIPVLNAQGEITKGATLLEPVGEADESEELGVQQRRLKTLEPWIASLQVDGLPDIEKRSNPLSQWSVKTSEWQRGKEEKKLLKGREKAQAKLEKRTEKAERKLEKRMAKHGVESAEGDVDEGLERRMKDNRKVEKAQRKHDRRISKAEDKAAHNKREEKAVRKVLWLIIRPLDADSGEGENPDLGSDFSISSSSSSSEDERDLEDDMGGLNIRKE